VYSFVSSAINKCKRERLTPDIMQIESYVWEIRERPDKRAFTVSGTQFFTGLCGIASKRFRRQNFYDQWQLESSWPGARKFVWMIMQLNLSQLAFYWRNICDERVLSHSQIMQEQALAFTLFTGLPSIQLFFRLGHSSSFRLIWFSPFSSSPLLFPPSA